MSEGNAPPVTNILNKQVKVKFIKFLKECAESMTGSNKDKIAEMVVFVRTIQNLEVSMDKVKWPNDDFIRFIFDDVPRILVSKDLVYETFDAYVSHNGISNTAKLLINECFRLLQPTVSVLKLDVEGCHFFPTFSVQEWQNESGFTVTDRIKQCLSGLALDICTMNQERIANDKIIYQRYILQQSVVQDTYECSEGFESMDVIMVDSTPSQTIRIADTYEGTYIHLLQLQTYFMSIIISYIYMLRRIHFREP